MDKIATIIKQRLSLREPLKESLDIVAQLATVLDLKKDVDIEAELAKVKALYPTCTSFEREFPSLCFSIATGVGKTRLMGACIAYLHLEKNIRNFFILAPNLTIYNKLIRDFGDPGYEKYVFQGISEFVHNRPKIITGDNYNQSGQLFSDTDIRINIFNVSKFNRDAASPSRGKERGMLPRIKRLSEYLGQSYWSYLSNLNDLVILMDEAHRYHADASKTAINELKPILGLELTATPIDETGEAFKNVVYEYSLARALKDGKYVKIPAIATRKNFRAHGLSQEEIEKVKLEDAVSIHQDTKNELEIYALNNKVKKVKPFILVVCRDINHAREVNEYISSSAFFNGAYKGRVLQIDSSTRREEEIEEQFVELENYDNDIEIVVHVNMLKEGWDVNNLYTIVPLRAANAPVLIEQTIGRGLRLPYHGARTGADKVDKLTVVAHDNFEKVIEAAQDPQSVLNKFTYIEIEEDIETRAEVITSVTKLQATLQKEEKRIAIITNEKDKQKAKNNLDATKAIVYVLPSFNSHEGVKNVDDLSKPEVKAMVLEKVQKILNEGQISAFSDLILKEAEESYEAVVSSFKENIIEIPRMDLVQDEVKVWFEDFDLDLTSGFDYEALGEEIMVVELTGERRTDNIGVKFGAFQTETPVNQVVSELINYPEIDYDANADLLHKLAQQAISHLESRLAKKDQLRLLVRQHRKFIAARIYDQMKAHFRMGAQDYIAPNVLPFVQIEDWNFTALPDSRRHYSDIITPISLIKKLVFTGFQKACHFEYKFDSKPEKDFAYILENDTAVLRWLRPAPNQFRIYWANNSRQYRPDFVVETIDTIYLVETKAENELASDEVQDKKRAALQYCAHATAFTTANGGKRWEYLLIPHTDVQQNNSLEYFVSRYKR